MTITTGFHSLRFNIRTTGVERLSALRHSVEEHYPGFLVYLHPNTQDNLCPVNILAGDSVGGISTFTGKQEQLKHVLKGPEYKRSGGSYRFSTLIGINTRYCCQLEITQPTGHLLCKRVNESIWALEITFEIGRNISSLFMKLSPHLLPA